MVRGEEGGAASLEPKGVNSNEVPFTEIKSFPRRSQAGHSLLGPSTPRGDAGPALLELLQASQQSKSLRVAAGARSERLRELGKPRE